MAYTKHSWKNGEVITAEKLNCIEEGVDCLANCSNLWTNPQPEATFPAQDIAIETGNYRTIEICFITEVNGKYMNLGLVIDKRRAYKHGGTWNAIIRYGAYERSATVYDNRISFSDCKYGVNYNEKLIPYSIHAFE